MGDCKKFNCAKETNHALGPIKIQNKELTASQEIANAFNDHFTSIGLTLAEEIKSNSNYIPCTTNQNNPHTIFLFLTGVEEVAKYINTLKPHKTPGLDGTMGEQLINLKNVILHPLVTIFNKILEAGHCPSHLKTAVVRPIYKNGKKVTYITIDPFH